MEKSMKKAHYKENGFTLIEPLVIGAFLACNQ